MGEWKEYRLGEVCSKIGSGATPSGGKDAYKGGDFALIRSQNVIDFEFNHNGLAYINDLQARKLDGVIVNPEDILLNITGDSVARTCIVDPSILPARVNQHVAIIRINPKVADAKFIHAWLIYKKQELLNLASFGATRNAITKRMIENFIVQLPAIIEQKKIADILSALDDKIETNRKINARLEELAQGLFKSWFIDFEPFGGVMPEGWKTCKLEDILTVKYGKDHKHLAEGAYPVYGSGGIMRYVEIPLYEKESVLIPRKGTLNNIYYLDEPFWSVDTMFFTEMKRMNVAKYVFFFLKRMDFQSMNCGSAIPSMTTAILNGLKINLPSEEVLMQFDNLISPIFDKVKTLHKESARLAELRDTLLPKLMSGEIKVG